MSRWTVLGIVPGVLLLCLTVRSRPGLTWDSVEYCAAARALASRGTLSVSLATSFEGQYDASGRLIPWHPFVLWPPGYPMAIAGVARTLSLPIEVSVVVVNALALAFLIGCVAWGAGRIADARTAAAAAALFGVFPVVQSVYRMAWSETVFLPLCALAAVALAYWLEEPAKRLSASWLAAVAVGLAIHVRYTGVLVLGLHVGCATVALVRSQALRQRVLAVAASVVTGPLIGSLFLLHRLATLHCAFCEPRIESTVGLAATLRDAAIAAAQSLPAVYEFLPGPLDTAISLALLAGCVTVFGRGSERAARSFHPMLLVTTGFGALYAVGIVLLRTRVEFNSLDIRLIAPATFSALAIVAVAIASRLSRASHLRVAIGLTLSLAVAGFLGARRNQWRALSGTDARDAAITRYAVDYVRRHPDAPLFTDAASAVYPQVGFEGQVYWLPRTGLPRLDAGERGLVLVDTSNGGDPLRIAEADASASRIASGNGFIAWEIGSLQRP
jgi:4-amino-4-deoxy-L-arabinose transferase-like glycosyltransferase